MTEDAASPAPVTLCRALGRWDFTAIGVNQVIGGGIVIPFGPTIPLLGVIVSLAILAGATAPQLVGGLSALVVGAILFLVSTDRVALSRR